MLTRDDDAYVASTLKESGPLRAIQNASEVLLHDVRRFDEMCRLHRPQAGEDAIDGEWFDEPDFRRHFSAVIADISRGVRRLKDLAEAHVSAWHKLLLCNPYPATIGDEHGSCYAETVLSMGESRILRLRLIIGKRRHIWRHALTEDAWWPVVDAILTDGAERPIIDRRLVHLHLAKECQRATGSVTIPTEQKRGRKGDPAVAERRRRVMELVANGLSTGAIAEKLDIPADVVTADKSRARRKSDRTNSVGKPSRKKL